VVHVGFVDDGAPVVLPMIGKMGQFEDNPMAMYVHGKWPLELAFMCFCWGWCFVCGWRMGFAKGG